VDGLALIREARSAGLAVLAECRKLVIRGPKRAEPVARKYREYKAELYGGSGSAPARRPLSKLLALGHDGGLGKTCSATTTGVPPC
jgi:hypothetical protein